MSDEPRRGLFFRSELARLLVLVAIAVIGWGLVWTLAPFQTQKVEPPDRVTGPPPPIVPDSSPAFETVRDRTAIGFRDSAAYELLLKRARETTPTALDAQARRDVYLAQLYERPAHYRGVPLHIMGTCVSVFRYESKLSRTGWLYEAWVCTYDDMTEHSLQYPYACIFEDAPIGLPIGRNVSERVTFDGYFFKLILYQSRNIQPYAPVLVGRLAWRPPAQPAAASNRTLQYWMAAIVAVLFVVSTFRWIGGLRRSLRAGSAPPLLFNRPSDEIAPEALAEWVESVSDESEALRKLAEEEPERVPDEP